MRLLALAVVLALATPARALDVVGDTIPVSLTGHPGDAARGRGIVADRRVGLCLLCHAGPFPQERFQGNLGPDLTGVGMRLSAGQLRLRVAAARVLAPEGLMPNFGIVEGLTQVAEKFAGRPLLDAEQIEDVVAFLSTLREPGP